MTQGHENGGWMNEEQRDSVEDAKIPADRMLRWFDFLHLPDNLQGMAKEFCDLAASICIRIDPGPERTVALRKLLEAKDAAVRAVVRPGG